MRSLHKLILVCVVVVLAVARPVASSSLTFEVKPQSEFCVFENLKSGEDFEINFEVIRGGLLDIKFRVTNPVRALITDKLTFFNRENDKANEQEGVHKFTANMPGTYSICFDNRMSRWTPKTVTMHVVTAEKLKDNDKADVAKLEHLGPTVDSVIKISDELDSIQNIQHHIRVREQSHRDWAETTNSRVQWLAILESVILISLSLLQIRYVSGWFKEGGILAALTRSRARV